MVFAIFFTRIISKMPVPGLDTSLFSQWIKNNQNDAFNLFSSFTGGAFESCSIFALGVTPLISAQIVTQLLEGALPSLAKLAKRGEHGRKAIQKITNILAVIIAVIQSACMAIGLSNSGLVSGYGVYGPLVITVSMTLGSVFMGWIANYLTEHSIGNGVSILLMANIMSRLPQNIASLTESLAEGQSVVPMAGCVAAVAVVLLLLSILIIYMSEGYHPLYIQYSQKMNKSGDLSGLGMIPVKVSISGVMPVIFATSVMALPQMVAAILGKGYGSGYSKIFLNMMSQQNWFNGENEIYSLGLLVYLFLVVFFSFFYLPIAFNAAEVAESIQRLGGFVPGIRAGQDTEEYITSITRHLTSIGTVMLIIVSVVPMAICGALGVTSGFSGTSLVIVIGVVTDVIQQLRLEAAGYNYVRLLG